MIELRNVGFSYNKKSFIAGLDFRVRENTVTTILGANGCGKSTVLKLISGLLTPQEGEILLQGKSLSAKKGKLRARKVAFLQQSQVRADMTVEQLAMAGRFSHQGMMATPRPQDREMVELALEATGCAPLRRKNLRQISGGELQKAYLAMVMAQDAEVVLLDEPTAHLDLHVCHELMMLVQQMKADWGKTVLLVLHDLDLALRYSERIAIMKAGRLLREGDCGEMRASGLIEQVFSVETQRFSRNGKDYFCFEPRKVEQSS